MISHLGVFLSCGMATAHVTEYLAVIGADDMFHYNWCMRRPHINMERRSKVDKVLAISSVLLALAEFFSYLYLFRDQWLYNR